MVTIRDIFIKWAQTYLQNYGDRMPRAHLKTIYAIINCRTDTFGTALYRCTDCGKWHAVYQSCGNRHCPMCQHHKTLDWQAAHDQKRLPGHHFLATFTVPESLRPVIRRNQRVWYNALFTASSQAMKTLAADTRFSGGKLSGFMGVLHTWGRLMQFHPHIHYLVPGGTISAKDGQWHPSRPDFYVPVRALSRIFKAKLKDELKKHDLDEHPPHDVWTQEFNVNVQPVGSGERTLAYLSRYVFKVAITNNRVRETEDGNIAVKYKKKGSRRMRTAILEPMEFIRRFLQHVLPKGFKKVRYYGFLHHSCSFSLHTVAELIQLSSGLQLSLPRKKTTEKNSPRCPLCKGPLRYLFTLYHPCSALSHDTS